MDGYFVGNTIGDAGLSAINIVYPIEALIQALGTGIGMGGAVYYSINAAEKKGKSGRRIYCYKLVASCNSKCYQYHNYLLLFRLKFFRIAWSRWNYINKCDRLYQNYSTWSNIADSWNWNDAIH